MLTFLVNYLVSANIVSNIPAWFYWSLIFLGLVIKNFAYTKNMFLVSSLLLLLIYSLWFHQSFPLDAFICNCIHIAIMNIKKQNYGFAS